jgi:hypothetical protein
MLMLAHDKIALDEALALARNESQERAEQIDGKLAQGEKWAEVAGFCAYLCQMRALRLEPWQWPPSDVDLDDPDEEIEANTLLREMLAAGVSRFEPDPLRAIAEAKKTRGGA